MQDDKEGGTQLLKLPVCHDTAKCSVCTVFSSFCKQRWGKIIALFYNEETASKRTGLKL